jgi:glutamate-1-semialdehyde 2,1-aminomutase
VINNEPVFETINLRGNRLMNGLNEIFEDNSIPAVFNGYPSMFTFALGVDSVTCQRDWAMSDREYYLRLVEAAIERGVMPDYDAREPWFLCYSHSETDIDRTLEVYAEVVKTVR